MPLQIFDKMSFGGLLHFFQGFLHSSYPSHLVNGVQTYSNKEPEKEVLDAEQAANVRICVPCTTSTELASF